MILATNKMIELGARNVLIKGGHLKTKKVEDIFLSKKDLKIFISKRYLQKIYNMNKFPFSCGKNKKSL